jgi:hypothetical protein
MVRMRRSDASRAGSSEAVVSAARIAATVFDVALHAATRRGVLSAEERGRAAQLQARTAIATGGFA